MKRPAIRTMVLGHPIVATALFGGVAYLGFDAWTLGEEQGAIPAVAAMVIAGYVSRANRHVTAYRSWKRAWDGMAEPTGPGIASRVRYAMLMGIGMLVVLGAYISFGIVNTLLTCGAAAVAIACLRWLIATVRNRRGRRAPRAEPVTVVAKPLASAPDLTRVHAELPDYCRRILTKPKP